MSIGDVVEVVSGDGSDCPSWYITEKGSSQIESGLVASKRRQSVATRYALRAYLRVLDPKSRVAGCGRHIVPEKHYVSVRSNGQQASVNNLMMCGLLWLCPVCAAKITEERRREMKQALEECAKRFDYKTALLTLTIPHYANDRLSDLLDLLDKCYRSVTKGRDGMALREAGWRHSIRAFENTWGRRNGWHPHLHVLLFAAASTDLEALRSFIEVKWLAVLAAAGRSGNDHAVDLRVTDGDVWSYVSKFGADAVRQAADGWGVSGEMTKGHIKHGRNGRYTPFDLLRAGMTGELPQWLVARVWSEYRDAIKGRRQLVFSHGLKSVLGITQRPDMVIAETAGEELPEIARLTHTQWRVIFNRNAVGDLLQVVMEDCSLSSIRQFLESLGCEELSTWVV